MISVEIWNKESLWGDQWFHNIGDAIEEDLVEGYCSMSEMIEDALDALAETGDLGESFSIFVRKVA